MDDFKGKIEFDSPKQDGWAAVGVGIICGLLLAAFVLHGLGALL